jgi:ubiquinone/menaquinone biosynthesis C-methylase UbiE
VEISSSELTMEKSNSTQVHNKSEVIERYKRSSGALEDFEKGLWGSEQSMLSRFRLAHELVSWAEISRWIDVGCGVGRLFSFIDTKGIEVSERIGLEISPEMLEQARQRRFVGSVEFHHGDVEDLSESYRNADLITLIGVLQLCGCNPSTVITECAKSLNIGGQLFLTTKNIGWDKFQEPSFHPAEDHIWFRHGHIYHLLESVGFRILQSGGLIPKTDKRVSINQSHTMYFLAERVIDV